MGNEEPFAGIYDAVRWVYTEDGRVTAMVYWVVAVTTTHEFHHHHRFDSLDDAQRLCARVQAHIDAGNPPEGFSEEYWTASRIQTFEEKMADEFMWEVKDAMARGEYVPIDVAYKAGLA